MTTELVFTTFNYVASVDRNQMDKFTRMWIYLTGFGFRKTLNAWVPISPNSDIAFQHCKQSLVHTLNSGNFFFVPPSDDKDYF